MLDMQGFSALWQIRLVSLWVFSGVFSLLWTPIFVYLTFTLKLFLGEKFQCGKNSFVVIGIGSGYFLFIFEQRSYIFNNLAQKMPDLKEESIVAVPLIQSPSVTFEE